MEDSTDDQDLTIVSADREMARAFEAEVPAVMADWAGQVKILDTDMVPGSEFNRAGYDPDDPWSDSVARQRAYRYWPMDARRIAEWLSSPADAPQHLLLAIPGAGGRTTVRYAWELDLTGTFEYFPQTGRWGFPLGKRLQAHPALGKCLREDRGAKTVQVLQGYAAGIRVLP